MCDKNITIREHILIVIDFWSDWMNFRQGGFFLEEDYAKYLKERKQNCINLIKFFNSKKFKVINADYSKNKWDVMREPLLNFLDFNGNINFKIPKNSKIYIVGSSFDQCVINRSLGYRYVKNSVIVKDCVWYGDNKMEPIDYLVKNINYKRSKEQFKSINELILYEKNFLIKNKIRTILMNDLKKLI
tara:strand:- start:2539 stop:3099 length:561 start_codon:yes stop_codon:yes gene_type:complete